MKYIYISYSTWRIIFGVNIINATLNYEWIDLIPDYESTLR